MGTVITLIVGLVLLPPLLILFKYLGLVILLFILIGVYEFTLYLDRKKAEKSKNVNK